MKSKLRFVLPENYTGLANPKVSVLKSGNFEVIDIPVTGDAPKEFIRAYFYGEARKEAKSTWKKYIAKTGHKWYPNESTMEYLMSRLGETIGLKMAECRLVYCSGQIRYLSQYFLEPGTELVHGADIYSGYVNDSQFVHEIEEEGKARDFFTIKFTQDSISHLFPNHSGLIFKAFIRMVFFDAIVGNNDRHFYNWGVIRSVRDDGSEPCFSPIYDTARGLFWNYSEEKIVNLHNGSHSLANEITKYTQKSLPKLGWESVQNINHFKLVEHIITDLDHFNLLKEMVGEEIKQNCINLLEDEFTSLLSRERINLVKTCLSKRFELLNSLLS